MANSLLTGHLFVAWRRRSKERQALNRSASGDHVIKLYHYEANSKNFFGRGFKKQKPSAPPKADGFLNRIDQKTSDISATHRTSVDLIR
jgi:hypothetical protein